MRHFVDFSGYAENFRPGLPTFRPGLPTWSIDENPHLTQNACSGDAECNRLNDIYHCSSKDSPLKPI